MRAFGRDHSHRADKLRLSRLQGPRRTRLRDQRAEELAPGSSSSTVCQAFAVGWSCPPVPSLSWAMLNFAFTEFSEVRMQEPLWPRSHTHKDHRLRAASLCSIATSLASS